MLRLMLRTLFLGALISFSAPAMALYKCKSGGHITYSDQPCPGAEVININGAPPPDAAIAKQQAAEERAKLNRLQNEQRRREAQEEKQRQRAAHDHAVKQKRCKSLALRKKWADEDLASASEKSVIRARAKVQRVAQQYEVECGK
jgi:uncharacterized protein with WD repeat